MGDGDAEMDEQTGPLSGDTRPDACRTTLDARWRRSPSDLFAGVARSVSRSAQRGPVYVRRQLRAWRAALKAPMPLARAVEHTGGLDAEPMRVRLWWRARPLPAGTHAVSSLVICFASAGLGGCGLFAQDWKEPPPPDPSEPPAPLPPEEVEGEPCDAERPLPICLYTVTEGCAIELDAACVDGVVECPDPSDEARASCPPPEPDDPPADLGPPPPDAEPLPCDGSDEACNGIDDDCDGEVDEGFGVGEACFEGEGHCAREGVISCDGNDAAACRLPQAQLAADDGQCDGFDDDCDGIADEDPPCNGGPPGLALDGPRFGPGEPIEAYWSHIPAGTYPRGAEDRDANMAEQPAHVAAITRSYLIARYEVTIAQWRALMPGEPAFEVGGDDKPVERINWYEALAFCNALSAKEGLDACYALSGCADEDDIGTGCGDDERSCGGFFHCSGVSLVDDCTGYRLPTEAEWEVAARGGRDTPFWFGSDETQLREHENCNGPQGGPTEAVTAREANPYGLRHTLGNVAEWVFDVAADYPATPGETLVDPVHAPQDEWLGYGPNRITRGGSPGAGPLACRTSSRRGFEPQSRYWYIGLRLARSLPVDGERVAE